MTTTTTTIKSARDAHRLYHRVTRIDRSLGAVGIVAAMVRQRDGSGRLEWSGETYRARAVLRAAGCRWDARARCWHAHPGAPMTDISAAIVRALASR